LKREIDTGRDPISERHANRVAPTMADLATRYLEHAGRHLRPRSLIECRTLIERNILPAIGTTKVSILVRADVVKLHADMSGSTPVRANRMLAVLRHMLNLAATEWNMRDGINPASAIRRNPEQPRNRFLEPDELGRLMVAINEVNNQQSANVIKLALLTGARRGELFNATWDQFNLSTGVWTKPASVTKQKRLHVIPLNEPAHGLLVRMRGLACVENVKRVQDGLTPLTHVFPGNINPTEAQTDVKRTWATVCKAAGITGLRFNDLRHSFASFLASSGHNLPLIGQLLGHSQASTTQRYAHLLMNPQRLATEQVGNFYRKASEPS
jgi:integrase